MHLHELSGKNSKHQPQKSFSHQNIIFYIMKKRAYIFWAIFVLCHFNILAQNSKVTSEKSIMGNPYLKDLGHMDYIPIDVGLDIFLFKNHLSYLYIDTDLSDTTQYYVLNSYYLAQDTLINLYEVYMTKACYDGLRYNFSKEATLGSLSSSYTQEKVTDKDAPSLILAYEVAWEINKKEKLIFTIENTFDKNKGFLRTYFHTYIEKGHKRKMIGSDSYEDPSFTFSNIVPYILDLDGDGIKELAVCSYGHDSIFLMDFYKINIPKSKKSKKIRVKKSKA